MKEMPISQFKAKCLSVIAEVQRTGESIRITRFGKPMAEVVASKPQDRSAWFGCMAGELEILGDIVGPIGAIEFREKPLKLKK
jgi:prevent-host-death family protein